MTRRDYILNHFATKFTSASPVASTAVGAGTLSALVAAVLSKKGKRLRNAGIAGVAGAAVGAGGGAAIGAQRKKRAQQAAQAEAQRLAQQQAEQAEAQRIAQDAAQQPKAPYSAFQDAFERGYDPVAEAPQEVQDRADAIRERLYGTAVDGAKTTNVSGSSPAQFFPEAQGDLFRRPTFFDPIDHNNKKRSMTDF